MSSVMLTLNGEICETPSRKVRCRWISKGCAKWQKDNNCGFRWVGSPPVSGPCPHFSRRIEDAVTIEQRIKAGVGIEL